MTPAQTTLPTREGAPPEEQDFHWRAAVLDRIAGMDVRRKEWVSNFGSFRIRDLGDLLITDWECPQIEGVRGNNFVRRDDDALLLFTASAGEQIIECVDRTVVLRPGAVLITSTRVPWRFVIPHHLTKQTIKVPMAALSSFDTGSHVPSCLLMETAQSPLAGIFQDFLIGIDHQYGRMSSTEIEAARTALLTLIAGMIRASEYSDLGDGDLQPLLRRQLETWIVDHLSAGAVKVQDLAAAHNVAPRTVHRAFEATGDTVGSIVRKHRLAAARADLVNTNLSIAAIAHRWGFCDASHLGREFRRHLSSSPGDYREAHGTRPNLKMVRA
ncbi:AraC family transcriptional regulator [Mycobacterium sp. URHB0044]|uniref:AraC family transcriptional regulator n=1 Tax=Mycobacterium sp. URHB0044 TaxID=1380386 RepID=UPI00048D3A54|nr:AraC family transcriptional regulator [Mycobacterium sp. URHB0044]